MENLAYRTYAKIAYRLVRIVQVRASALFVKEEHLLTVGLVLLHALLIFLYHRALIVLNVILPVEPAKALQLNAHHVKEFRYYSIKSVLIHAQTDLQLSDLMHLFA